MTNAYLPLQNASISLCDDDDDDDDDDNDDDDDDEEEGMESQATPLV